MCAYTRYSLLNICRIELGKVLGNDTPRYFESILNRIVNVEKQKRRSPTDTAGEHGFIVNVALCPCHQMLNVLRGWHLRRSFEVLGILPEVLESAPSMI